MKKHLKEEYEKIQIPQNYSQKVEEAIQFGQRHKIRRYRKRRYIQVALVCSCVFMIALNTNSVFAKTMSQIPYVGKVCQVLTFLHIDEQDKTKIIYVDAPSLSKTGHTELEQKVNHQIQSVIDREVEGASKRAQEYYSVFIETGGNAEEFIPVNIQINYEVKYQKEGLVSFVIEKTETLASAYQEYLCYNIDLEKGNVLSLKDLVGKDYQNVISQEIKKQISQMSKEDQSLYFEDADIKNFINAQSLFYINQNGQLVIKFQKYEIAVGAAGPVEFIMPTDFIKL